MGKSYRKKSFVKNENLYLLPFVLLVAIVPLIVYMKGMNISGVMYDFWKGNESVLDFFSYYKSQWIIIGAVCIILSLMIKKGYEKDFKIISNRVYYILLGVYAIWIIISTVFSKYGEIALNGFVERYEGALVLLAYVIVAFAAINLINSEKKLRFIIYIFAASVFIVSLIGVLQYAGVDFYRTDIGKSLIVSPKYSNYKDAIQFNFEIGRTYSSLYNPNYVGSYVALAFPVMFMLALYEKKMKLKIIFSVISLMTLISLVGSHSSAGLAGTLAGLILIAILMRDYIKKYYMLFASGIVSIILILLLVNVVTDGKVMDIINTFSLRTDLGVETNTTESIHLDDIRIIDNRVYIDSDRENLIIERKGDSYRFFNTDEKPLEVKQSGNMIYFTDNRYKELYKLAVAEKGNFIEVQMPICTFQIYINLIEETFKLAGDKGRPSDIVYPEKFGFENNEKFGSSRGYIWSRSLPMLKNTILIGYGPDLYPIFFPQEDYIGKLNAFRKTNIIVDKPHNMYLQIGINTGVVSLVAFLFLLGIYFISSIKLYIKNEQRSFLRYIGVGIFAAIFGYSITGLFNDSVVSVAPVFWVLIGTGISVNYMFINIKKSN